MALQPGTPAPPPDLQLQLIVDSEDDFLDERRVDSTRRPSTASLSRFRSCPQLASIIQTCEDSPTNDMAPITDIEGNIMHTTPAMRNSLQVDGPRHEPGGARSAVATPTPPSTPGSRRRDPMSSSFTSRSHSNGTSPASTPKMSRRFRSDQGGYIPRTCSADSQGALADTESLGGGSAAFMQPLKEDNLRKHLKDLCGQDRGNGRRNLDDGLDYSIGDERLSDMDDTSSMHVVRRRHHHHQQPLPDQLYYDANTADDSVHKCSRWLQSLKLSNADKIKSRSQIQLPPI